MRALPFLAAPVAVAISFLGGSARADGGTQAPTPAASTPIPAATPAPAQNMQTATTASGQVVVVAPAGNPNFQIVGSKKDTKRVWYGWQTLIFDGVAVVGGATLAFANTDGGGWFWLGTYTLAPPIVHWAHGRVGIGFADLGVRLGAPVVGTLLGGAIGCSSSSGNGLDDLNACVAGLAIGFLVGYGSAIAVDAAVFARETVEIDPNEDEAFAREKRKRASTFTLLPDVGFGQNRATVGIHGMF
jgi:hypothetical protein